MLLAASLLAFLPATAWGIELDVINDLNEKEEGSVLQIEDARSVEAPDHVIHFTIHPGEKKSVTGGHVKSFILIQAYPRHKLKYEVVCPKKSPGRHTITLLDVYNSDLPGDCQVVRTGHWSKRSGMNWGN